MREMVTPGLLIPEAKVLLSAGFAICLIRVTRGSLTLEASFERLVIGYLALLFFQTVASGLLGVSSSLTGFLLGLGSPDDLKTIVLEAFQQSSSGGGQGFSLPAALEQAWRTGVWGIMNACVDGFFLISSFLLECAREVLWKLLFFLFPLACGTYPVLPRLLPNFALYAVELALWEPMLVAVKITTAEVARVEMVKAGSWGLYVVAVEVLSILLILGIPAVTHRFLASALSGDFDVHASMINSAKKAIFAVKTWGIGG